MGVAKAGLHYCGRLLWAASDRRDSPPAGSVVLPRRPGQPAILFLYDTRTTSETSCSQKKVLIGEETGIRCLKYLCQKKTGDQLLVSTSAVRYRELWKEVVKDLVLTGFHYMPYWLRRGGGHLCPS